MESYLTSTFLTNWKTTVAGVLTILVGATGLFGVTVVGQTPMAPDTAIGLIIAGLTGLVAHDATTPMVVAPVKTTVLTPIQTQG